MAKSKVSSYDQHKFQKIMQLDNISEFDIMTSLSMISNRKMIFKAGQGAGKSGSFFFESFDKKFIIKSISSSEKKVLLNLLDDLIFHLE